MQNLVKEKDSLQRIGAHREREINLHELPHKSVVDKPEESFRYRELDLEETTCFEALQKTRLKLSSF